MVRLAQYRNRHRPRGSTIRFRLVRETVPTRLGLAAISSDTQCLSPDGLAERSTSICMASRTNRSASRRRGETIRTLLKMLKQED